MTAKAATTTVTKIETKNASAYERSRPLFVTPTAKIKFVLTENGDRDAQPGTRRRYVNYPRKNSNLNDWNNLMIILIIDAHITIIRDRLINITPPPVTSSTQPPRHCNRLRS